ncbi:MAG: response regulator [Candidatus Omnitrophica bacterium]|nr:response regulator [Candidatus Omnitrophota bacterium]MDD5574591.1 response regulator [Candidatus Omnitrophota bacterium]
MGDDKKTILIIDDEVGLRNLLKFRLVSFGFDVLVAEDGYTGIDLAKSMKPNLIILDIMMPYFNGIEVCRKLKSDYATKDIPVVFLSVLAQKEDIEMGKQAGAEFFLTKPYDPEKLNFVIRMALNKQSGGE